MHILSYCKPYLSKICGLQYASARRQKKIRVSKTRRFCANNNVARLSPRIWVPLHENSFPWHDLTLYSPRRSHVGLSMTKIIIRTDFKLIIYFIFGTNIYLSTLISGMCDFVSSHKPNSPRFWAVRTTNKITVSYTPGTTLFSIL